MIILYRPNNNKWANLIQTYVRNNKLQKFVSINSYNVIFQDILVAKTNICEADIYIVYKIIIIIYKIVKPLTSRIDII